MALDTDMDKEMDILEYTPNPLPTSKTPKP